jgi:hypothetical protein
MTEIVKRVSLSMEIPEIVSHVRESLDITFRHA